MKKMLKNKKGFTLIEIIVVVVILAVLMAVSVPAVLSYINQAEDAKYIAQARGAFTAMQSELVKEYVVDGVLSNEDITKATLNAIETLGTSKPTVTNISVDIEPKQHPNEIKKYYVSFDDDGVNVTVTPNGNVEIERVE